LLLHFFCLTLQIGGALIGPHALNIISDVHAVQHLAELGVVFLLFNIGLELSLERLQSMAKYVFGMGAAQVGTSSNEGNTSHLKSCRRRALQDDAAIANSLSQ
jgi:predicted Kef-type K+ transport protein